MDFSLFPLIICIAICACFTTIVSPSKTQHSIKDPLGFVQTISQTQPMGLYFVQQDFLRCTLYIVTMKAMARYAQDVQGLNFFVHTILMKVFSTFWLNHLSPTTTVPETGKIMIYLHCCKSEIFVMVLLSLIALKDIIRSKKIETRT